MPRNASAVGDVRSDPTQASRMQSAQSPTGLQPGMYVRADGS